MDKLHVILCEECNGIVGYKKENWSCDCQPLCAECAGKAAAGVV